MSFRDVWKKWMRVKHFDDLVYARRWYAKWLAVAVVLLCVVSLVSAVWKRSDYKIAEIHITSSNAQMADEMLARVKEAGDRSDIHAIWLRFEALTEADFFRQQFRDANSVYQLAELVRSIGSRKPVVGMSEGVLMGDYFWVYAACTYRISLSSSLFNGALVPFVYSDLSGLMGKLGITMHVYESNDQKFRGPPWGPLEPAARNEVLALYDRGYKQRLQWLKSLASNASPALLNPSTLHTAIDAMALGLVDALGSEKVALNWLERKGELRGRAVKFLDYTPKRGFGWLMKLVTLDAHAWHEAVWIAMRGAIGGFLELHVGVLDGR